MDSHGGVLIKESSGIVPVCADSSDGRGRVDHQLGAKGMKEPVDILRAGQIKLAFPGRSDTPASGAAKTIDDVSAQEAAASGYEYSFINKVEHTFSR
jgi:hypothetical protein